MILFWIIINFLRNLYRRYIRWQWLQRLIKYLLNSLVNFYAALKRFGFPKNYVWSQKLEMLREKYEPETARFIRGIIKPGMAVIDVGAHIGYFTRILAKLVGPDGMVYAIEADPANFKLLKKNTERLANVRRFETAAGNKNGEIEFYKGAKTGTSSSFPAEFRAEKISVSSIRMDDLARAENISRVDFMKIDVEGGEPAAMDGALEMFEKNPDIKIILEFSPENLGLAGVNGPDFLKKISSLGFDIFCIKAYGLKKLTERQLNGLEPVAEPKGFVNLFGERPDKK